MAKLEIGVVSAEFAVAQKIEPESMSQIAEAGFRSVINSASLSNGKLQKMASVAGLQYADFPLRSPRLAAGDVRRFRTLVKALPKPILSFCATGKLSRELYRLAMEQSD